VANPVKLPGALCGALANDGNFNIDAVTDRQEP